MLKTVIVTGFLNEGFCLVGPFDSVEEAEAYAANINNQVDDRYHFASIFPPSRECEECGAMIHPDKEGELICGCDVEGNHADDGEVFCEACGEYHAPDQSCPLLQHVMDFHEIENPEFWRAQSDAQRADLVARYRASTPAVYCACGCGNLTDQSPGTIYLAECAFAIGVNTDGTRKERK